MQAIHSFQVKIDGINAPVTCNLYADDDSTPYWDCVDPGAVVYQVSEAGGTSSKPAGCVVVQDAGRFRFGYLVDIPASIEAMKKEYKDKNGNFKKGWRGEVKKIIDFYIDQCKKYADGSLCSYFVRLECLGVESSGVGEVWLENGELSGEYVQEIAQDEGESLRENMHARANELMSAIISIEAQA